MAYKVQRINPLDLQPRKAVGVALPFSSGAVFNSTFTSKDAIRNNILNYFLTGRGERVLNVNFGAGLRNFIFETITADSIDSTKASVKADLEKYFPQVNILKLELKSYPDQHLINLTFNYSVRETNIVDELSINFEQ